MVAVKKKKKKTKQGTAGRTDVHQNMEPDSGILFKPRWLPIALLTSNKKR